jgi:hypothetical protein
MIGYKKVVEIVCAQNALLTKGNGLKMLKQNIVIHYLYLLK